MNHNIQAPNSKDTRPLYRKVESYIESLIHNGGLRPGEAIPSHAQLAQTLGVNTLTVKRAIRELSFKQVLISLQGRGTFVAEGGVKRILWITETDLFGGELSAYYGNLFRQAAYDCERNGLRLEPVWLPKDRPFDTALNANGGEAAILGYFFSGCDPHHGLFLHVKNSGRPFVNLSASQWGKPKCVLPNFQQAQRLALEHIAAHGHHDATVFTLKDEHAPLPDARSLPSPLKLHLVVQPTRRTSIEVERDGYQVARELLAKGELKRAIYITDDVIARGVTRAILESTPATKRKHFIIVQSSLEEIIPLGLPVTHLAFDIANQAAMAVKLLLSQIRSQESESQFYCDFEILSEEQTAALYQGKQPEPPAAVLAH